MGLQLQPCGFDEAKSYIAMHHRHHNPPQGCKFCIGVSDGEQLRGVIVVGRPIACSLDNGFTAEVTRCCTDGAKNAASMLYGAAWRAAKAMGYLRLITYIRADEPGTSLVASGWEIVGERPARSWQKESGRIRVDKTEVIARTLFEAN